MTESDPNRFQIVEGETARQQLLERLDTLGWRSREGLYLPRLMSVERARVRNERPAISVVVISWRLHRDTRLCLERLESERDVGFELIFVDNGAGPEEFAELRPFCDFYIRLDSNTGAYLARNLGAAFANAPVILFLEDDGLPAPKLLASHLEAYRRYRCISVRGVYHPKTDNPLNDLARHYYLGDSPFPQYVVVEGNASYAADPFFAVGGWDDEIRFGGGGLELARRLTDLEPDLRKQIYYPDAAIYHDYVRDEEHLKRKRTAQLGSFERLERKHPDLRIFRYVWRKFVGRPDLLLPRPEGRCGVQAPTIGLDTEPAAPSSEAWETPEPLRAALAAKGWSARSALADAWLSTETRRPVEAPAVSVVVTTTSGCPRAADALGPLATSRGELPSELIAVAPEGGLRTDDADIVVRVRPGTSTYVARNLGAVFSRAPILLFLHGDGEPGPGLVEAHHAEHRDFEVLAVQGCVRPRDPQNSVARQAGHFVLGDERFPLFADHDDNTSYDSRTFFSVGGWDDEAGLGTAGFDLARRIAAIDPDLRKQIYSPYPTVHRDEATDDEELTRKRRSFERSVSWLQRKIGDYDSFLSAWTPLQGRSRFVVQSSEGRAGPCARRYLVRFQEEPDYQRCLAQLQGLLEHFPEATAAYYPISLGRFVRLPEPSENRPPREAATSPETSADPCARYRPPALSDLPTLLRSFKRLPWFWSVEELHNPSSLSIFCLATYRHLAE